MPSLKSILLLSMVGLLNLSAVASDSAGIVEMVNGLAYGGIPYGSVTGMVARYQGIPGLQGSNPQARQLNGFRGVQPLVVTPNFRTTRLAGSQPRAELIYRAPGAVAPGVLGTINQIGF